MYVAAAMKHMGGREYQLWDENDEFFYDVLRFPDGRFEKIRVRSLVGMIPLFAIECIDEDLIKQFPNFHAEFQWFVANKQGLVGDLVRPIERDGKKSFVLSIANQKQLASLLTRSATTMNSSPTSAFAACRRRTNGIPSNSRAKASTTSRPKPRTIAS